MPRAGWGSSHSCTEGCWWLGNCCYTKQSLTTATLTAASWRPHALVAVREGCPLCRIITRGLPRLGFDSLLHHSQLGAAEQHPSECLRFKRLRGSPRAPPRLSEETGSAAQESPPPRDRSGRQGDSSDSPWLERSCRDLL